MWGFQRGIERKTDDQVEVMAQAGHVVAQVLTECAAATRAGVTTADLDEVARDVLRREGALSNFLHYGAEPSGEGGFTGVICTSVNDEVVHGIPGPRVLRDGDLISIDAGAIIGGWHGDAAVTVAVGSVDESSRRLSEVTAAALAAGIAAAVPGARLGDVGHAIWSHVDEHGLHVIDGFTGHGIGTAMHLPPDVPNEGVPGRGPELRPGVVIAIEPMVAVGTPQTRTLADGWTAVTTDGSRGAHWEHTVAVTESGPRVLTVHSVRP